MSGSHTTSSGADHGTLKSYIIGFILSILLTVIPYYLVVEQSLPLTTVVMAIVVLGVAQLIVQLVFFLHLNTKSEQGWNFLSFVFTAVIVAILLAGSLWIMYNLRINMMMMH
ncbi:cytochrome o ubiquinol oxidase subunit IV [uncultured Shewanella sp.]|uniref:cytochrome o ubiquinol oxidase subunit IV n=1 Tax=uncultured Shewanella sp. TaxID=173975 RepID=UPI00260376EB|nr:cytochrome o ubiquinol oxidase subunit IV [uncultured Shewanella sp.]